jgi:hypothetical protein
MYIVEIFDLVRIVCFWRTRYFADIPFVSRLDQDTKIIKYAAGKSRKASKLDTYREKLAVEGFMQTFPSSGKVTDWSVAG